MIGGRRRAISHGAKGCKIRSKDQQQQKKWWRRVIEPSSGYHCRLIVPRGKSAHLGAFADAFDDCTSATVAQMSQIIPGIHGLVSPLVVLDPLCHRGDDVAKDGTMDDR